MVSIRNVSPREQVEIKTRLSECTTQFRSIQSFVRHILDKVRSDPGSLKRVLEVLGGPGADVDEELEDLDLTLFFARHAYQKHHFEWSLQSYLQVLREAHGPDSNSKAQEARYRLSDIFTELATVQEAYAIQTGSVEPLTLAERGLWTAILLIERYFRYDDRSKVVKFNAACIYSVLARVRVHGFLIQKKSRLCKTLNVTTRYDRIGHWHVSNLQSEWENKIGRSWRKTVGQSEQEKVDEVAGVAMDYFKELSTIPDLATRRWPNATTRYWMDAATGDPDFAFLQFDDKYSDEFRKFTTPSSHDTAVGQGLLRATDKNNLPQYITEKLAHCVKDWDTIAIQPKPV